MLKRNVKRTDLRIDALADLIAKFCGQRRVAAEQKSYISHGHDHSFLEIMIRRPAKQAAVS